MTKKHIGGKKSPALLLPFQKKDFFFAEIPKITEIDLWIYWGWTENSVLKEECLHVSFWEHVLVRGILLWWTKIWLVFTLRWGRVYDQEIPINLSLRICFLIASTVGHTVYLDMLCSSSYLYDDCITDPREFKYKLWCLSVQASIKKYFGLL